MQSIKLTVQKQVPEIIKAAYCTHLFSIIDRLVIDCRTFGFRNYEVIPQTAYMWLKSKQLPTVNKIKNVFLTFYFDLFFPL